LGLLLETEKKKNLDEKDETILTGHQIDEVLTKLRVAQANS
jgi:hypothetical protein